MIANAQKLYAPFALISFLVLNESLNEKRQVNK